MNSKVCRARVRRRTPRMFLLLAVGLLAGCADYPIRALPQFHPQFEERSRGIKSVAIVPEVKVFRLTAGGVREQMDEWSETARKNVLAAVSKQLKSDQVIIREFDPMKSEATRKEFEDARALFQAVAQSAILHTFQPGTQLKTKMERFDYTLGPLPVLSEASETDALLFVQAVDVIPTAGRIALNVTALFVIAAIGGGGGGKLQPVAGGLGLQVVFGQSALVTALVDSVTGDILWFNTSGPRGAHDLREPTGAESLVADAFKEFGNLMSPGKSPAGKTQ